MVPSRSPTEHSEGHKEEVNELLHLLKEYTIHLKEKTEELRNFLKEYIIHNDEKKSVSSQFLMNDLIASAHHLKKMDYPLHRIAQYTSAMIEYGNLPELLKLELMARLAELEHYLIFIESLKTQLHPIGIDWEGLSTIYSRSNVFSTFRGDQIIHPNDANEEESKSSSKPNELETSYHLENHSNSTKKQKYKLVIQNAGKVDTSEESDVYLSNLYELAIKEQKGFTDRKTFEQSIKHPNFPINSLSLPLAQQIKELVEKNGGQVRYQRQSKQ